ncbi:hypothetical protein ABW20_dc0107900 [Dactylellina cionopaga]|nr:hypothetical protein ABW20_dc0107900 [Dactylellina cionopaga]
MADWRTNPYWNLDLAVSTTTTSTAPIATQAAAKSQEIPLSSIVYRSVDMTNKVSRVRALKADFNPLILRIRFEIEKFFARMPKIDISFLTAPAKKLVWVAAVVITAFIAIEIGMAVYRSYMISIGPGKPKGPVIPINPTEPIGVPIPPNGPPNDTDAKKPVTPTRRDVRIKLFSEILTGYLTLILSVSVLLGDSIFLKFLLSGLTGFVGMVSLILPDEAEWSAALYNYKEGGFEMKNIDAEDVIIQERGTEKEEEGLKKKAETKLKEMRGKVAERIQEANTATKKVKQQAKELLTPKKKDEDIIPRAEVEELEGGDNGFGEAGSPNEDLRAQLSRAMAPVKNILDTDKTIEKASKKVEEWLMKAGDSFGADGDEQVDGGNRAVGNSDGPSTSNQRNVQIEDGVLKLR